MPPGCVNSEEPAEVVYFPEMQDGEFIKKEMAALQKLMSELPGKIAEGLSSNPRTFPSSVPSRSAASSTLKILGALASFAVVLGVLWAMLSYVISSELRKAFEQPNKDFASLRDKDVGGLIIKMDLFREDLSKLKDWQTTVTFAGRSGRPGSSSVLKSEEIKELAIRARERGLPADVSTIQVLAKPLQTSTTQEDFDTLTALVNLRSFVNSNLEHAKQNIVETVRSGEHGARLLIGRGPDEWIELIGGVVQLDGVASEPGAIVDDQKKIVDTLANLIIKDSRVVYHGGKVTLINVFFENCTFDIKNDSNGRALVMNILDPRQYTTFRSD